ncbi:MAG: N-acetyltransferase [Acidobacteria bacterium]|nr:N-acetyltransferase [Acidobacteriota bacterium]
MHLHIRPITSEDWPQVCAIYIEGIATGHATFETYPPSWDQWHQRHLPSCRLLATGDEEIRGWAALTATSARPVYRGVAEVSVYVSSAARRRGVGKALLAALIAESEQHGFWTLQAGIFPENATSIALHTALGFRPVGIRERLGQLGDRWRDVILMERRSRIVGV